MTETDDIKFLRISFIQAQRALEHGNHPFGAVLVSPDKEILLAAENSLSTHKDVTAHAELNLIRAATKKYPPELLKGCTVYASAEPCPMCASAIIWANIRRVVFGLGMQGIYAQFGDSGGDSDEHPSIKIHAHEIFSNAPWPIETIGPILEKEAEAVFKTFK